MLHNCVTSQMREESIFLAKLCCTAGRGACSQCSSRTLNPSSLLLLLPDTAATDHCSQLREQPRRLIRLHDHHPDTFLRFLEKHKNHSCRLQSVALFRQRLLLARNCVQKNLPACSPPRIGVYLLHKDTLICLLQPP